VQTLLERCAEGDLAEATIGDRPFVELRADQIRPMLEITSSATLQALAVPGPRDDFAYGLGDYIAAMWPESLASTGHIARWARDNGRGGE